jgi:DNA-binding FadR family transcriptional regulator
MRHAPCAMRGATAMVKLTPHGTGSTRLVEPIGLWIIYAMTSLKAEPLFQEGGADSSALIKQLMDYVTERRLRTGDRLPSERDLAEKFGVGRNAIREAVTALQTLRLVERRPNSGLYLLSEQEQGSIDAILLYSDLGIPMNQEEVREVVELRRLLEIQAVTLACERHQPQHIERLDAALRQGAEALTIGRNFAAADEAFHLSVIDAAGNRLFRRLVNLFYLFTRKRRVHYFQNGDHAPLSQAQHTALRDAIATRDVQQAVHVMDGHLRALESYWLTLIGHPREDTDP